MGRKTFWLLVGLSIMKWACIDPVLARALIGMFLFAIGVLQPSE